MTAGRAARDASLATADLDRVAWLADRLGRLLGPDLRADALTRAAYSSDASSYRVVPRLVAIPGSVDHLAAIVATAAEAGVPITMRGAGTSVAGNAIGPGLVVDTSRHLTVIRAIDPEAGTAVIEPGAILDDLNRAAAVHGLRFGPDPSTHDRATIGGMIGNDACGARSIRWGTTAESTVALDLVRADGSLLRVGPGSLGDGSLPSDLRAALGALLGVGGEDRIRRALPPWPRRVSGYALDWLLPERGSDLARALVGTEGTCAVVAGATVALVRPPAARGLLVLGFPDDVAAAEAVPAILPARPATVEGMTAELVGLARAGSGAELLPPGGAWLYVEAVGEDAAAVRAHAAALASAAGRTLADPGVRFHADQRSQAALWRTREDGAGRATRAPDGSPAWPGFEDATVPPERLAAYLAAFRDLLCDAGLKGTTYGHFGEGCVHVRIGFDFGRPDGADRFAAFMATAADLVVAHGGSLSGEHGDGRARSALLPRMFGPEVIDLFARFKAAWDPAGILNPGVVVAPAPIDAGLRPAEPTRVDAASALALRGDADLRAAVGRCVGVGRCASRTGGALMCPSFRATGEEKDSTRGRARVLQELLAGSLATEGWRSEAVAEALDLCLACRGCLTDCPTGVDMARYRSEFLDRHWRGRIRPRAHYSLGRLPAWLRIAIRMPSLANAMTQGPGVSRAFAFAAGIAAGRTIPRVAARTFVAEAGGSRPTSPAVAPRGRVVLWPDTFTNHLAPEVGHAALRVLEAAGFEVEVPTSSVCCGLTWMTTGQLDGARGVVRRSLGAPELAGSDPVVVLEPSCATALRSDVPDLLPDDPRAAGIARRVRTFAEILDGVDLPLLARPPIRAVVQPHCHQQAVLGTAADLRLMERAGIEVTESVVGCCGLAGDFGATRGHERVSAAVAGLALLPALGRAAPGTLVLADGFSCRTQVAFLDGRRASHLAEVLADRLAP